MSIKTAIKIFLVAGLIFVAGYLTFSLVSENINQKREVSNFCTQKCNYNATSLFWEFAGDNGTKGFTTQNECFSYCSRVKEGFIASFMSSPFISHFFNAKK